MSDTTKQEIKLFYCYAHEDRAMRDELEISLSGLKRQYCLTNWSDREILPGEKWEEAIDRHISTADVILLLISSHFLDSDYCYGKEMQRALERHRAGTCHVIPILLHSTYWEGAPFSSIQMLPADAKAITSWSNRREAFYNVAKGIGRVIKALLVLRENKEEWLKRGNTLNDSGQYEEALNAIDQAIHLDSNYVNAYMSKGVALQRLRRFEEALSVFDQAIRLDPNYAKAYVRKGFTLHLLRRWEKALTIYDQAIRLDPNDAEAYYYKGTTLSFLKKFERMYSDEEALNAIDQAIHLNPNYAEAYAAKGVILFRPGHEEEALAALDQATRLDPNDGNAYAEKSFILRALGRHEEAKFAYSKAGQLGSWYVKEDWPLE